MGTAVSFQVQSLTVFLDLCAVMFGVGRHLYNDNTHSGGRASPPPARPSAAPRLAVAVSVDEDPTLDVPADWDLPGGPTGQPSEPGGTCPDHGTPWTLKEAGVSKTGRAYDAFWKCDGKYDDGSFCKNKPPKAWAARREQ